MAIKKVLVQEGSFSNFYPSSLTYNVGAKIFFFGLAVNKKFIINSINSDGKINISSSIDDGFLDDFYDFLQVIYDPNNDQQYLYGINIEGKKLELFKILSTGKLESIRKYDYTAGSIKATAFYILNDELHYYSQSVRNNAWDIHKYSSY
ncbi:hypothetical protein M2263_001462 [Providencia alcalifaciens]|nr:hypothetical protein [Providencia alcalifaciens]